MTHKVGEPAPPVPNQPPPPEQCVTAVPTTLAEALEIIEAQRQRIEAWQKLERGAESMVPKGDDGPLQWTMLETGLDVRFNKWGQLMIQTNTPPGTISQLIVLRPSTAFRLTRWLTMQDWGAIKREAIAVNGNAKGEFEAIAAK